MKEKKNLSFSSDSQARKVLLEWWKDLEKRRGDRAALRHCHETANVAFTPSYHRLRKDLDEFTFSQERLTTVAGVLSHVKNNEAGSSFATQMATPKKGSSNARVSGLRFRRLLAIDDRAELFTAMIRAVRLLDGSVNISDLASSVYWWNDWTKKQWAYDYYNKAPSED